MTVNAKPTGIASTIPAGLAWGTGAAMAGTLLGAGIAAKLMETGHMQWTSSGYAVLVILILSAWLGASVAAGKIKRQRLIICLASGMTYFAVLMLMTALFFGGKYSGVGETTLLIFCGSMLGVFGKYPGKTKRKPGKMRTGNR
jgi:putative membrane protein (TIGR04086 family)